MQKTPVRVFFAVTHAIQLGLSMPVGFYALVVFAFGVVFGSFLNVLIYRLHTGKSINNRSHCLSCGHNLSWYELFPLLSFLFLRGRCLHCGSSIPYRYVLVEFLTGLAFLLALYTSSGVVIAVLMCVLLSALIVGAVYDLYHLIIPDEVVIAATLLAIVYIVYTAYETSAPFPTFIYDPVLGGIIAFGVFASLFLFSGGKWMGFADAKLAFPLGLFVGIDGAFSLVVLAFWIGAAVSLLVILFQYLRHRLLALGDFNNRRHTPDTFPPATSVSLLEYYAIVRPALYFSRALFFIISKTTGGKLRGRVTMKSEIPFAPFLVAAFVLVFFAGLNVIDLIIYVSEHALFNN